MLIQGQAKVYRDVLLCQLTAANQVGFIDMLLDIKITLSSTKRPSLFGVNSQISTSPPTSACPWFIDTTVFSDNLPRAVSLTWNHASFVQYRMSPKQTRLVAPPTQAEWIAMMTGFGH